MLFSSLASMLSQNYAGTVYEVPTDCELNEISVYKKADVEFDPAHLYLISAAEITEDSPLPRSFIFFGGDDAAYRAQLRGSGSNYVIVPVEDTAEVLNFLMQMSSRLMEQQKRYADMMYMLLSGADLSTVFCEFTKATGFQVMAIDISGKVLAVSKPFVINHKLWQSSVDQGYLDQYLVEFIHRRRVEGNMSMSTVPFIRYCDIIKIHVKGIRVISNGELVGYVFMGRTEGGFPPDSDRMLQAFSTAVEASLVGNRDLKAFHSSLHQNILSDLADGSSEEEALQRIRNANLVFPKYMRAVIIKSSFFRGPNYLYSTLLPALTAMLPAATKFIKNGSVVLLLEVQETGAIPPEVFRQLSDLAKDQMLRIGISNMFTQPVAFATYYQQALQSQTIARLSGNMSGIFFFSDYAFLIMLNNIENKELLRQVRMPVLEEIEKYDLDKNVELYNTLRIYSFSGFNKNKTAEIMFLHRNTINYRIQQLEELFDIDFSDANLLFKLQYSFYVDLFLKHRFADLLVSR